MRELTADDVRAMQADPDLTPFDMIDLCRDWLRRDEAVKRLVKAVESMMPLACCTCQKSPLGCAILSARCPFCDTKDALAVFDQGKMRYRYLADEGGRKR